MEGCRVAGNMVSADGMGVATWRVGDENWWLGDNAIINEIKRTAPTNNFNLCMLPNPPYRYDSTGECEHIGFGTCEPVLQGHCCSSS